MSNEPQSRSKSTRPRCPPRRPGAFYLLTAAGIPVYVHFTLALLLVFVAWIQIVEGRRPWGGLLLIIAVFTSIVLHELGHALAARRFGIKTDDIVLYPIGGVARLRSLGEGLQEFWIALAGPAVNVVIAALLWLGLSLSGNHLAPMSEILRGPERTPVTIERGEDKPAGRAAQAEPVTQGPANLLQHVMVINIILVLFNLIPAFPMDGGRVLRSLLGQVMAKEKATAIAATLGKIVALFFMIFGLLNPSFILLVIIGVFVFFAAGQEQAATRSAALMAGRKVSDAMVSHFETLRHGDSLGRAAEMLKATSQHDFPVMGGAEVIGVLTRNALIQGLAVHGRDSFVAEVMSRDFPRVAPDAALPNAIQTLREAKGLPLLVFDGDRLVGYIDNENIVEFLMIAQTEATQG